MSKKPAENLLSALPSAAVNHKDDGLELKLAGEWTVLYIADVEKQLRTIRLSKGGKVAVDADAITFLDTAGARVLVDFEYRVKAYEGESTLKMSQETHQTLVQHMRDVAPNLPVASKIPQIKKRLNNIGSTLFKQAQEGLQLLSFTGQMLTWLGRSILSPTRIRFISLISHMEDTGVNAVPIVSLLAFLIGLVIVYMGSAELAKFGAQVFAVNLLEIATLRELGPILTAIVVAGRSGSAFTAQIGAMKANEEISAMRVMGLEPMEMLVIPRVLGLMIMLPILIVVADFAGLLGGALASWVTMDLDFAAFTTRMHETANINNMYVGLVKAPFFAAAIALVGCYHGYQVTGSAESVGRLTTQSVVKSIFMVIVIDAVFAIFFSAIGM